MVKTNPCPVRHEITGPGKSQRAAGRHRTAGLEFSVQMSQAHVLLSWIDVIRRRQAARHSDPEKNCGLPRTG